MRVKIFFGSPMVMVEGGEAALEKSINEWLADNSGIKLIDIKFAMSSSSSTSNEFGSRTSTNCSALVIYE